MGVLFNVYTVPLFVAAAISAVLLALTVPQRGKKGAWPMIGFLTAIVVWTVSYGMMLGTEDPVRALTWHNLRFLGPTLATLSIFLFALEYTGRSEMLTPELFWKLALVPILTNVLVWTNEYHNLVRVATHVVAPHGSVDRLHFEWGLWYYFHALYSYLLALGAMVLFAEKYLRYGESMATVKQTRTMFLATFAPLIGSAVYVAGLTDLDLAPFGFAVSAVLMIAAIVFYS
jgi:lipid-A-disaccharide synthase-like uncharacterized protein